MFVNKSWATIFTFVTKKLKDFCHANLKKKFLCSETLKSEKGLAIKPDGGKKGKNITKKLQNVTT